MKSIPDKLLINLKILSKIEKNGRISRSYSGMISLEQDIFYQCIKRLVSQDSRKQSINEINSIVDDADTKVKSLLNNKYLLSKQDMNEYTEICEVLTLLHTELVGAKKGVENLRFTYSNDPNTVSQLDIVLLKLRSIIRELDSKLINFVKDIPPEMVDSIFMNLKKIDSDTESFDDTYKKSV